MRYLLKMQGGGVAILTLVSVDATVETVLAKWHPDERAKVVSWRPCEDDEIPADRTFRDAWVDRGTIAVDMPKARDIHRARMRQARGALLGDLDIAYQRADETGDQKEKSSIAAKKQALRDVTALQAIEAAKTPDDLKAVWPDVLAVRKS